MSKVETLTAYKCSFKYLQKNNPLKEELKDKLKDETPPEYTFDEFINDFCEFTESLVIGEVSERAILLPKENIFIREPENGIFKWRMTPFAGKHGKPFKIIKRKSGKRYDFGSDSAALYEHNIFAYQSEHSIIVIFHRQSGSGCKSVFLEAANKMLRGKGIRLEMELYLPLISQTDENIKPSKLQLQYVREIESSDIADNTHKRSRVEVIQDLGLNLESRENGKIKKIVQDMKLGLIDSDVAFALIKQNCPNADMYNAAEIIVRIGKRHRTIGLNEFDSLFGTYDITTLLHNKFRETGDFIGALSMLSDEYYNSIIAEEKLDAK